MFFLCVCVLGRVVLSWTVASMPFILILIFPSSQKFNNSVLLQVFFFSFFLTFLNLKLPLKMFVPDPRRVTSSVKSWCCLIVFIGTLRSDDGDANENVKKTIGLTTETTTLHMHHVFLYISLPSPHDYDVKMPNSMFYRGRTQATTKFPLSF